MRITFIRANMGRLAEGPFVERGRMEPLEIGVLAALTPPDVECLFYDDRVEDIPYDEPTDLVAITVEVYTARRSYEIAAAYRRRGMPVILGGFHVTLCPEEGLEHADAIYVGDAESHWGQVVADARRGSLQRVYRGVAGIPQAGGVRPRRDLYYGKDYLPITLLQATRGCPYPCDFCAISAFFGRRQIVRPIADILAEIERQERRWLFFVDDNFLANRKAAKDILRALVPLKIRWISQASIDMADDPELMDLVEASGCLGTVTGFESLDPRNLAAMRKTPNLRGGGWDHYQKQVEVLRRHHLQTWASFTLGHDHDTSASIAELYDFAVRNRFCFAAFNILMPYPGTPLYKRLAEEDRLLWDGKWWLHPDYRFYQAAFVPKCMTPEALTEQVFECHRKWNSAGSIFQRVWDFKTHLNSPWRLMFYLYYNRLYSKDCQTKQDMRFGHTAGDLRPAQTPEIQRV